MTEQRKHFRTVRIAIIAAAVVVMLAVTITAVSLNGVISEVEAYHAVTTSIVNSETDEYLKKELSNCIQGGLVYGDEIGTAEADLGLSEGRLVYKVSLKTAGYSFKATVDAKTAVVIKVEREVDPDWEKMLPELKVKAQDRLENVFEEVKTQEDDDEFLRNAKMIFVEHFGLYAATGYTVTDEYSYTHINCEAGMDDYTFTAKVGGYIYSLKVNRNTYELSDERVTEDPDYTGEKVRFEPVEGIIGFEKALSIAKAELDLDNVIIDVPRYVPKGDYLAKKYGTDVYVILAHMDVQTDDGGWEPAEKDVIIDARTGDVLNVRCHLTASQIIKIISDNTGLSEADGSIRWSHEYSGENYRILCDANALWYDQCKGVNVTIDFDTKEVVAIDIYDIPPENGKDVIERNQVLSHEAVDGLISEAAAVIVALDNSGVSNDNVWSLKAELDGEVYKISWLYGYVDFGTDNRLRENTYEVDASTGEILNCDALTPADYLTEDQALEIARKLAEEEYVETDGGEFVISEERILFSNTAMGYPEYEITIYSGQHIYRYILDAVNGKDHIVR